MSSVAGGIDAIEAVFDDGSLVADAGLLLAGTVMSMLVGGRCIDDTDRLRSGASGAVLPFEVVAPSTEGTFLRSFTSGMCASSTKRPSWGFAGRGLWAPRPTWRR